MKRVGKNVGKEKPADHEHFSLYSQCFKIFLLSGSLYLGFSNKEFVLSHSTYPLHFCNTSRENAIYSLNQPNIPPVSIQIQTCFPTYHEHSLQPSPPPRNPLGCPPCSHGRFPCLAYPAWYVSIPFWYILHSAGKHDSCVYNPNTKRRSYTTTQDLIILFTAT